MVARLRWTRDDGERWAAAWRLSGKSRSAFAREHGIALHRLHYWAHGAVTLPAAPIPDRSGFVEVRPAAAGGAGSGVSVRCGDGVRVEVMVGFDAEVLRAVVSALSAR
jgi:hypothetical protein